MILALFGTNPYPFERLANWLERLAREEGHNIEAQTGATPAFGHCRCFDFLPHATILTKMKSADCIITQGGYGGCLDALYLGRPLIIVPRCPELGECRDNQAELSNYLADNSDAFVAGTYEELRQALTSIKSIALRKHSRPEAFGRQVGSAINAFLERSKG